MCFGYGNSVILLIFVGLLATIKETEAQETLTWYWIWPKFFPFVKRCNSKLETFFYHSQPYTPYITRPCSTFFEVIDTDIVAAMCMGSVKTLRFQYNLMTNYQIDKHLWRKCYFALISGMLIFIIFGKSSCCFENLPMAVSFLPNFKISYVANVDGSIRLIA